MAGQAVAQRDAQLAELQAALEAKDKELNQARQAVMAMSDENHRLYEQGDVMQAELAAAHAAALPIASTPCSEAGMDAADGFLNDELAGFVHLDDQDPPTKVTPAEEWAGQGNVPARRHPVPHGLPTAMRPDGPPGGEGMPPAGEDEPAARGQTWP